ncbi:hypothetical protein PG984_009625 [Apiospora sp. TS-2023a]
MGSVTQEAQLLRDIHRVAVIGAGISGVASAAHLLRYGLDVAVFERSSIAGGVWHYDPRTAREPPYPNEHPPVPADLDPSGTPVENGTPAEASFDEVSIAHAPPGPCYVGLRNNVPTSLMRSTLLDWPEGSEDFVSQDHLEKYVQRLAKHTGAQEKTLYDTSVESVHKPPAPRNGPSKAAPSSGSGGQNDDVKFVDRTWQFDAVVVASGHYHEPRVPAIPGLSDLKRRFPDRVMHSKRYRTPALFRDKNVFIIGAGVSSLDIARESEATAKRIYQSSRGGHFDLPASLLPASAERVAGIHSFIAHEGTFDTTSLSDGSPIPFEAVLTDGTRLRDIDHVVLGTGYISSYPFLSGPHLQTPAVPPEDATDETIITSDGGVTHNLHKDLFYLPDPTLAFVGVPYHVSTFSLFDFQAEVAARVFAGRAALPLEAAMRREYEGRRAKMMKTEDGSSSSSKEFHSLWGRETEYIDELLGWVNGDAALLGYEGMKGVDDRWRSKREEFAKKMKKIRRWPPVGAEADGEDVEDGGKDDGLVGKPAEVVRTSVGLASA